MSKGLSKRQSLIVGLLTGTVRGKVYGGADDGLSTPELVDELYQHEALPDGMSRQQAVFTVRRACDSLCQRGLLEGVYERGCGTNENRPSYAYQIRWKAKATNA
ncbi:MAG: hypothetical protein WD845_01835 [Pirellulales bacterium]